MSLRPARKRKIEHMDMIPDEFRFQYPRLHHCPNHDFLLINDDEPEFDSCGCFYHDGNHWYFPFPKEETDASS